MSRRDYSAIYAAKDGIYAIVYNRRQKRLWERVYPRRASPDNRGVWVDAFAGRPAPTGFARGVESGVGIDEPPEHFVGSLGHLGT